jgi:hypothetical protein
MEILYLRIAVVRCPHLARLKSPTVAMPVGYEAFDRRPPDSGSHPNQLDRFR